MDVAETPLPFPVATRCCALCGETKPITEFYWKNNAHTRRHNRCKKCVTAKILEFSRLHPDRVWGNKPQNKKKKLERWRLRYKENPEKYRAIALTAWRNRREAALKQQRERYAKTRDQQIAKTVRWNKANPGKVQQWKDRNRDKIRGYLSVYRQKHPKAHLVNRYQRRLRKKKVGGRLSVGLPQRLFSEQKGLCPYCKTTITIESCHMDHLIPLARGGSHSDLNMQLTCKRCNLKKHAKDPIEFAASMGLFIPATELAI